MEIGFASLPRPQLPDLGRSNPLAGVTIPIWGEGRIGLERAALSRSGLLGRPHAAPRPRTECPPVMLIPGFMAGDTSLSAMARWLRGLGWAPCRAEIRMNVDCTGRAVTRLEQALERHSERHQGQPVTIIGHSRGGVMARTLAVRRPDLVARIATLGSPLTEQFAVHPLVRQQIRLVATLGSAGMRGLFTHRCMEGECCAQTTQEAGQPLSGEIPFLSIYSRSDGIVNWRACLDPQAEHLEVRSSHCGMAVNAAVFRALQAWLPDPAADTDSAPQPLAAAA